MKSATSLPSPSSHPRPANALSRTRWAWTGGFLVTVVLLAWAVHGVDPRAVVAQLRRADARWFVTAIVLATATFPLRTVRWRVMLRDSDGQPLPWLALWDATAVGFMANNLLPARAGEFARAYVARRRTPVRFATALASIGVERVFDGVVLVALFAVALAVPTLPAGSRIAGVSLSRVASGAAAVFGVLLVTALLVVYGPPGWRRVARLAADRVLPAALAARLRHLASDALTGLEVLRSPSRLLVVLAWSVCIWTVNAASFAACFAAFGLPLPATSALILQALVAFGVALPSSPGFFGPFEALTRVTLGLYGVSADRAITYAVAYHVGGFVPITLLGLASLSRSHLRWGELRQAESVRA